MEKHNCGSCIYYNSDIEYCNKFYDYTFETELCTFWESSIKKPLEKSKENSVVVKGYLTKDKNDYFVFSNKENAKTTNLEDCIFIGSIPKLAKFCDINKEIPCEITISIS